MRNLRKTIFGLIAEKRDKVILFGIFGFVFVLAFLIFSGKAQADLQPIRSVELTSSLSSYASSQPGAWKIDKSAEWISEGKARITFDVNSIASNRNRPKDVLIVLDNSGSMVGAKFNKVKDDTSEIVESILSDSNNTVGLITFASDATILSGFTNDKTAVLNQVSTMSPIGETNYYDAILKMDEVFSTYSHSSSRDAIVLFMSDGYPCKEDPKERPEYKIFKDTYGFVSVRGIQYEMGDDIREPIIAVSDMQFAADMWSSENILHEAISAGDAYSDFIVTDYINDTYFDSVLGTKATIGSVDVAMDGTTPKVTWDMSGIYHSGLNAKLTIDISLKSGLASDFVGPLPTNRREDVSSRIGVAMDENLISVSSPTLLLAYTVSYDSNSPSGCTPSGIVPVSSLQRVYSAVEISSNELTCEGYSFKGWSIAADSIEMLNDDYFKMPGHDVTLKAIWSKVDIEKSMEGTVSPVVYATLDVNETVNVKMKRLAGTTITNGAYTEDSNVVGIRIADQLPIGFTPSTDNTISYSASPAKIYAWFDSGYIYMYTPADGIELDTQYWSYEGMFQNLTALTDIVDLGKIKVSGSESFKYMFLGDSSLTDISPLDSWKDAKNVETYEGMFASCTSLTSLHGLEDWDLWRRWRNVNVKSMFSNASSLTDISALSNWDVSKVENMDYLFYKNASLTDLRPLTNWDVSNVKSMEWMFANNTSLVSLSGLELWTTTSLEDTYAMFEDAHVLTDISALANWNTDRLQKTSWMFAYNYALSNLAPLNHWVKASAKDISAMFYTYNPNSITNISALAGWDVSGVENMNSLFYSCTGITDLSPLSGWVTSNVNDLSYTFKGMTSVTNLAPISGWDVSKAKSMSGTFSGMTSITSLSPLSSWTPSTALTSMNGTFSSMTQLTDLSGISDWDVSGVTTMSSMFGGDSSVTSLAALSGWHTDSLKELSYAFRGMSSVTSLAPLSGWNTSNVTTLYYTFKDMTSITDLTGLSGWSTSLVTTMREAFSGDRNITDLSAIEGWDVSGVSTNGLIGMFDMIPSAVPRPSWF